MLRQFRYFKRADGSVFKKNLISADRNAKGYFENGCVEVTDKGKELNPKQKQKPKAKVKKKPVNK